MLSLLFFLLLVLTREWRRRIRNLFNQILYSYSQYFSDLCYCRDRWHIGWILHHAPNH